MLISGSACKRALDTSNAILVVIGKRWVNVVDNEGRRRLDNEDDFVRIEVETALSNGITVYPLLVDGASMPIKGTLPHSLEELCFRQAINVRSDPILPLGRGIFGVST